MAEAKSFGELAKKIVDRLKPPECEHDYERVGHVGLCIIYRCRKCDDEYEKDVS